MRVNYKLIIGLILIVIGVVLIVYAQHALHHHVPVEAKSFFDRVKDFFVGVGNWFKSTAVAPPPSHSNFNLKIMLWVGALVTAIGALFVIFCRKRP
jgi:hypothetical protein